MTRIISMLYIVFVTVIADSAHAQYYTSEANAIPPSAKYCDQNLDDPSCSISVIGGGHKWINDNGQNCSSVLDPNCVSQIRYVSGSSPILATFGPTFKTEYKFIAHVNKVWSPGLLPWQFDKHAKNTVVYSSTAPVLNQNNLWFTSGNISNGLSQTSGSPLNSGPYSAAPTLHFVTSPNPPAPITNVFAAIPDSANVTVANTGGPGPFFWGSPTTGFHDLLLNLPQSFECHEPGSAIVGKKVTFITKTMFSIDNLLDCTQSSGPHCLQYGTMNVQVITNISAAAFLAYKQGQVQFTLSSPSNKCVADLNGDGFADPATESLTVVSVLGNYVGP